MAWKRSLPVTLPAFSRLSLTNSPLAVLRRAAGLALAGSDVGGLVDLDGLETFQPRILDPFERRDFSQHLGLGSEHLEEVDFCAELDAEHASARLAATDLFNLDVDARERLFEICGQARHRVVRADPCARKPAGDQFLDLRRKILGAFRDLPLARFIALGQLVAGRRGHVVDAELTRVGIGRPLGQVAFRHHDARLEWQRLLARPLGERLRCWNHHFVRRGLERQLTVAGGL